MMNEQDQTKCENFNTGDLLFGDTPLLHYMERPKSKFQISWFVPVECKSGHHYNLISNTEIFRTGLLCPVIMKEVFPSL